MGLGGGVFFGFNLFNDFNCWDGVGDHFFTTGAACFLATARIAAMRCAWLTTVDWLGVSSSSQSQLSSSPSEL